MKAEYTHESAFHRITVRDAGQRRILQFERNQQSSMYLDSPFDTDMEYPAYLHLPLAVRPDAERALVIGLGGGMVVKRMWRDYPGMTIDAVEIDADVVEIAREFFELPDDERIRVHVADGREFIDACEESYDIVVVDAFDDTYVPVPLTSDECLRTMRGLLAPDGAVAFNFIGRISGDRSKPFRSLYRTLSNVWRRVWVFRVNDGVESRDDNLVLLATDAPLETAGLRERIASRAGGLVTVPAFHLFGDDLYDGPVRAGDVRVITDPRPARHR